MHPNSPPSSASASEPAIPAIALPLLSLAAFASGVSARMTDPLLPQLAKEFAVSLGDASNVITLFSIAYGISQLLFGPLGDRYGKYLVVACGCIACAITSVLCSVAVGFEMLVGARLLAGATAAAVIPLSMAWIGDVVPYHRRQAVIARFLIGQILGLSVGTLVGGLAADWIGWRIPFFCLGLMYLAIGVVLLMLNRRLPAHARAVRKAEGPAIPRMVNEFRQVLVLPWARLVLITVFLEGACVFGSLAFIATHMHHAYGMSLTAAGALAMLFGFGGMLFAMISGPLVKRMGEPGLALCGGMSVTVSLLSIALAPSWPWAIPGCFLAGFGFYMMHNTLQINATQMAPERRGAAVAAFASSFFLGQSMGVGAAGMAVEGFGTATVLIAGGIGVLALALNFRRRLMARAQV